MSVQERATNGLKLLMGGVEPFSQVQAAWRFYNNKNVTIQGLFDPILEDLEKEVEKHCGSYVLMMSDWSHLDYKHHHAKKELTTKNKRENTKQIGYDLQTTLAVSDISGVPISPVVHNLKTDENIYSTYSDNIDSKLTHLEELAQRATWIKKRLSTDKKIVHIVDRESDSVAFMRELHKEGHCFVLRVKNNSKLYYPEEKIDIKQGELARKLPLGKEVQRIKYKKENVKIYVNECDVEVQRNANKFVYDSEGKKKLEKTSGDSIKARFVVERLVNDEGNVIAQWLLITNIMDKEVKTQTLATWYYYRWKIESYFKLLKSSGFNLEQWQQEEPRALFKRLLVVSYACVLVWKIANDSSENANKIRKFLVQLSGKLIEKGTDFTHPALLTGLWSYLQIMDVIDLFTREELLDIKKELVQIMGFDI